MQSFYFTKNCLLIQTHLRFGSETLRITHRIMFVRWPSLIGARAYRCQIIQARQKFSGMDSANVIGNAVDRSSPQYQVCEENRKFFLLINCIAACLSIGKFQADERASRSIENDIVENIKGWK